MTLGVGGRATRAGSVAPCSTLRGIGGSANGQRVAGASAPASRHMNQFGAPSTSASAITS